jgi:membrane protein implicated in regulation of membrane protease activity
MTRMAALLWLIVGLLLIAAEVLTADLTLAMLGVSGLAAAGAAGLGAPVPVQLLVFAAVAISAVTLARPVLRKRLHAGHHVKTNVEALVGTRAIVVSTVDAHSGQVKIGGEIWSARTYDETQVLEPGRPVTVMDISGATAVVWGEV